MSRYIGDQNVSVFINESGTYGSASGTGQWLGLVQSVDPDESTGIMQLRYQGTSTRNVNQFVNGPLDFTGTLSLYPQDFRLFAFALGSCVDGGSPSPYTHVISELNNGAAWAYTSGIDNPFPSFTIEASQKGNAAGVHFVRTYNGVVVNQLTLTASQSEPVTLDVDWVAQNCTFSSGAPTAFSEIYGGSTITTEPWDRPYIWSDVQVQIPSGAAGVLTQVRNVTFSINNNLDARHYDNGSRVIKVPAPGIREYSLDLTMDGTSESTKTFFDQYFLGGAGSQFNMLLVVNASTGSRSNYISLSGCVVNDISAPAGIDGVNEQTVSIVPTTCVISVDDPVFKYNPW